MATVDDDSAGALTSSSSLVGVSGGGSGANMSATGPGVLQQASAGAAFTATLTPTLSAIVNSGTLTLPTSTDTLVGRATTDTLTNKTLTSPAITTPIVATSVQINGGAAPTVGSAGWVYNEQSVGLFVLSGGTLRLGTNSSTTAKVTISTAGLVTVAEGGGNVTAKGFTASDGGTVTQASSITTGVTLNTTSGQITTVTGPSIAAGAEADFTVTNSVVAVTSNIVLNMQQQFTDGHVQAFVKSIAAGSFVVTLTNVGAAAVSAGTAIVNFHVLGGSAT